MSNPRSNQQTKPSLALYGVLGPPQSSYVTHGPPGGLLGAPVVGHSVGRAVVGYAVGWAVVGLRVGGRDVGLLLGE
jgi:hypothetical protein